MNDVLPHDGLGSLGVPLLSGVDRQLFEKTLRNARATLLGQRNEQGWWTGELSSSALSTATAIVAMQLARKHGCPAARGAGAYIERGYQWLLHNQNEDGGWGDTDKSKSNISTTMLVWAALGIASQATVAAGEDRFATALARCEAWLAHHAGSMAVADLVQAVMKRYGKDRTFSVPILTMCALCGRLGPVDDRATWRWVKQLPFEFAAFPRSWFSLLNLQVVSYALPALIAIGQARHHHRPTRNPIARLARHVTRQKTLRLLEQIQPPNGGFLEATPLTSFVAMSLAASGNATHPVVTRAMSFIIQSARPDGSWPIDTNLATWVTTLSINALAGGGQLHEHLNEPERHTIRQWLLAQQYKTVHPYTGAAPGGWSWTDLPGGVPDADDTSGAVIALQHLDEAAGDASSSDSQRDNATRWLQGLQNRDGGIPTFCSGWGRLPFDRSSNDITAHFLRTQQQNSAAASTGSTRPLQLASTHLAQAQAPQGFWLPLWFGNQHREDESNPVYGTSRVLCAAAGLDTLTAPMKRGTDWLIANQNEDGGWGGSRGTPSTIEETALALEGLTVVATITTQDAKPRAALTRGVQWLIEHTAQGTTFPPSPIGFYFAKLWYYEKLYPVIYTVAALERIAAMMAKD